ncbi:MAG: HPr family phosphocarrier protein [Mangrovibacterium sp.]
MVSERITIQLKTGLHARPASRFTEFCKSFKSDIVLRSGGKQAPGVSIIKLLALGLKYGSEVEIIAEGEDETLALKAVLDFFKNLDN